MISINIEKKDLWLLASIMIFIIGVGFTIAYGGTTPTEMGHSVNEIERCGEGEILKVSGGLWVCSEDSGTGGTSYIEGEGITISGNTISIRNPTSTTKGGVRTTSCGVGQAIRQIDSNGNVICSSVPSATCSYGSNTYSVGAYCAVGSCSDGYCSYQICQAGGTWSSPNNAGCTYPSSGCPYDPC